MTIEYRHNTASQLDILCHLKHVAPYFVVDLATRVNLDEYAQKLYSHAELEEAWHDCDLIGLVAYYNNANTKESFVSNVSVDIKFQKQGIASALLNQARTNSLEHSMKSMRVEVANDANLISYYQRHGFMLQADQQSSSLKTLIRYFYPLVAIRCTVYNHEPYLRDCLDGFVMQKTNFPFVAIVHDDASTDNSAAIIREYAEKYPDIIQPIYETENQWSKRDGSLVRIMNEALDATGCTYVAMCEGDDYWTDSEKLQKQVEYMESHSDFTICFHRIKCLMQATGELVDEYIVRDMPGESSIIDLAQGNYIHSPSVVYRFDKNVKHIFRSMGDCLPGDYVLWMLLAGQGKIWKMEEPMAVYRVGSGIWSTEYTYSHDLVVLKTYCKLYPVITNQQAKQYLAETITQMSKSNIEYVEYLEKQLKQIQASKAYRLGKAILKPFSWLRRVRCKV